MLDYFVRLSPVLAVGTLVVLSACGGTYTNLDTSPRTLFDTKQTGIWNETGTRSAKNLDLTFKRDGSVIGTSSTYTDGGTWVRDDVTGTYSGNDVQLTVNGETYKGTLNRIPCAYRGTVTLQGTTRVFDVEFRLPC